MPGGRQCSTPRTGQASVGDLNPAVGFSNEEDHLRGNARRCSQIQFFFPVLHSTSLTLARGFLWTCITRGS